MGYKVTKANGPIPTTTNTFQTFEDLEVYKAARELRKAMYVVSRCLPDLEKYDLGREIRRATVSLTNNMAKGHGRFRHPDQIRFFRHSRGSLEEFVDDLNVCLDENCVSDERLEKLKEQAGGVLILINGYLHHVRNRATTVREVDERDSEYLDALDDLVPL